MDPMGIAKQSQTHIIYFLFIYGYGSIPINTIFRGMNIHLPAILMWTTGIQGFDTLPYFLFISTWKHIIICCPLGPWAPGSHKSLGPSSSYSPPRCYRYRSHSSAGWPNYRLYDIGYTMVYHMNEVNHGKNHGKPKFINHPKLGFMKVGIWL